MNILIVAAHPDDEVLGAGGTIARHARDGEEVAIVILGEGQTSRYPTRKAADPSLVSVLAEQAKESARRLGAKECICCGLPDNRFDTLPLLDIVKLVEEWVQRLQPQVVYSHHPGDLNVDHGITARAVLTATRPAPGCPVRELYAFEVPSSSEWSFQRLAPPFAPNAFVDIAETLQTKLTAMEAYESEVRPFPHPRPPEALEAIARRWGSVAGVTAAEAFELVRAIR